MMDVVILDADEELKGQVRNCEDRPKNIRKRKRVCMLPDELGKKEIEAKIEALRGEMDSLFRYYNEVIGQKEHLDFGDCNSTNAIVAALMEESCLPFSKLVSEIYEKLTKREWGQSGREALTQPMVKATVLFVGQRVMYGIPNADADVLEDDSETCLWCWETRDFKVMPKSVRAIMNIRRTCRQKIHNRITAISAMLTLLQKLESEQGYDHEYVKAVARLEKVFDEAKIRSLVDDLLQRNSTEKGEKEAKREQNLLASQVERNKRDAEKVQKRMDREMQKEKLKIEKGQKEAEKDERRREKEDSEVRKQLRKQQEEVEKDQRRREKEEAELKKQASVQKQASIMERFLRRGKISPICQKEESLSEVTVPLLPGKSKSMPETCTQLMDSALASNDEINAEDLFRSHLSSWRHLGHSIRSDKKAYWGKRQKPKTALINELKLSNGRGFVHEDDLGLQKNVYGWGEKASDERSNDTNVGISPRHIKKCNMGKKLLQFDKSHRPAYYGLWPTRSHIVGPRKPFRKDLNLDYDVDSDEEWEEEEPGESLSDCDKDEECLEAGFSKGDDDDESDDGFLVPDGYLSENEGVLNDRTIIDISGEARSSPACKEDAETEEFRTLLFQQKHLQNLTELSLRKNQPFIISNLMHEKDFLIMAEDLDGVQKMEQTCLQVLSMRAFPEGSPIEMLSVESKKDEDLEPCLHSGKINATPFSTSVVLDSDLPTVVTTIQSCSQGMNKVVEALQEKFPSVSKSHLRQKVRELSGFMDNRWQVKKEVLEKLRFSVSSSPEKGERRTKSIAKFFSKRCLPPSGKRINPCETSPRASLKPGSAVKEEESFAYINK